MKSVWYKQFPSFRVTQGWKYTFALIYCLYNLTVALNQILSADVLTDLIANHKFCYLFFNYDSIRLEDIKNVWADFRTHYFHLSHLLGVFVHKLVVFEWLESLEVCNPKCIMPNFSSVSIYKVSKCMTPSVFKICSDVVQCIPALTKVYEEKRLT